MSSHGPDPSITTDELEGIEFRSPGRFTIQNPSAVPTQVEPWRSAPFVLGENADPVPLYGRDDIRQHALAMIEQARRSLCIYTPDLEPWLYDHSSIQQACSRFLLAHPRNRLRILSGDSSRTLRQGHRLIALARRLTSNLQIRKRHPEYTVQTSAFLIADDCGLLFRPEPEQYSGHALYCNPSRACQQQRQFDTAWDHSLSDPDLRSFLL